MKMEIIRQVQESQAFGLLTDEVADISVTENLVTFVQFFSNDSKEVETKFLACQDILAKFDAPNAEAISSLLFQEIQDNNLDVSKFTGLASDGASVMMGKFQGVAAKLRQHNPILINIHCVCHRLALACADSNESIAYMKNVELILPQLWQFFENSPKRMAMYLKIQCRMKAIKLSSEKTMKVMGRRLKKACRTRWLSLDASVHAVYKDFDAILQTLALLEEQDATACGLLKKMRTLKFLGVIYVLHSILPILADLSRHFQRGSINFSAISPAVTSTKEKLNKLLEENIPIESLKSEIDSVTDRIDIKMSTNESIEIESLFKKYVVALSSNIDNRISEATEVLTAFALFDPLSVPATNSTNFKTYGKVEVELSGKHFYKSEEDDVQQLKTEKLMTQWQGIKYHFRDIFIPKMPDDIRKGTSKATSTDWCLQQLLSSTGLRHFFPDIAYIAEVVASLPVSNAWTERGASALKNIKTKHRNRLGERMLEGILYVCINGPSPGTEAGKVIVKSAVKRWLEAKNRRKLPKKVGQKTSAGSYSAVLDVQLQDAGCQTDAIETDTTYVTPVSEQEQLVLKKLDLDIENEYDYSDDESDSDDLEC